MKRNLLLLATVGLSTMAQAEWKTSDTEHTLIGKPGEYEQAVLHSITTPNGSTVLTWLKDEQLPSNEGTTFGYCLYMQIFDAEGEAVFPQEGLCVTNQPTNSWVSDYALTCMANGDILIGYNDYRSGECRIFTYRYTEQGTPVWNSEGVEIIPTTVVNSGEDMSAQMVVSGENIYLGYSHTEYWKEKATEENWSPSPWFPDEEMPDSVDVSSSEYQIMLLNPADGSALWEAPKLIATSSLFMYPAPEGCLYACFTDENCCLYAQKLTPEGSDAWADPVTICNEPLSSYGFVNSLSAACDDEGGLAIALNVPNGWYHYIGITRLSPEGDLFIEPLCGNEDPNSGDCDYAAIATRDNYIFAAWPYSYSSAENYMWCNMFDADMPGDYVWYDDLKYGLSLDVNSDWGMKAVKVVPQDDGWVVLYGNCTSWSGANFMVVKVSNEGKEMWRKQICEDDFKTSGIMVESDGEKAIIIYTVSPEYDENWEPIIGEGGMFVMCVDLTNGAGPSAIEPLSYGENTPHYFDLEGRPLAQPQAGKPYLTYGSKRLAK